MYYEWYAFVMQWFKVLYHFLIYKNFNFFLGLAKTNSIFQVKSKKKKDFLKQIYVKMIEFFHTFSRTLQTLEEPFSIW